MDFRELGNKLHAYWLVRLSGELRRRPAGSTLAEEVVRALDAPPAAAVFGVEGVAFARTRAAWRQGSPSGLLAGAAAAGLPEESLILLHAGMGLALAIHLLAPLRAGSPAADFDRVLGEFLTLCSDSSQAAYRAVPIESLGLIARMFRSRLVVPAEAALARRDPELTAPFWHGAGRALYFLPLHLPPGGLARAVACCRREPRAAGNRLDALAGLAFAVAMINLDNPRAVARLLDLLTDGEAAAVTSGVVAGLFARRHTTPTDPAIAAFLAWRPADPPLRARWEQRVSGPGEEALATLYPVLRARGRLGDFTRFQRLPELYESLVSEAGRAAS